MPNISVIAVFIVISLNQPGVSNDTKQKIAGSSASRKTPLQEQVALGNLRVQLVPVNPGQKADNPSSNRDNVRPHPLSES